MRDYIIINGVNSLSIKGLAITKLPSIYKPIMRTEIEEIDGRNGDIITELGYGAYNKELTIGLFGDYDIDEIIAFFNQKGTIIFSNENDKIYNFDIIDQIEFEKLIKFRSASINIHCQPFKYPLSETPIEVEYEYVTGEGENITLDDTDISALELGLKGNTSQSGTPTPSSPIPVNVVSGDNKINVTGKNLLKYPYLNTTSTVSGVTFTDNGDGSVTINGTSTSSTYSLWFLYENAWNYNNLSFELNPGTYTFKGLTTNKVTMACNFYFSDNSNEYFSIAQNDVTKTITNKVKLNMRILVSGGITVDNVTIYPQIEVGSSSSSFEPYIGNTYPIDLPVENLLEPKIATTTANGITCTNNGDGSFTLNGTATANAAFRLDQSTFNGSDNLKNYNGTYTLSCNEIENGLDLRIMQTSTWTFPLRMINNNTPVTNTFNLNNCFIYINIASGKTLNNLIIKPQLEKGSKANHFTSYGTTPIELCKIGTYQDYIYKDNGSWYLHKEIGKVVLDGSESWTTRSGGTSYAYALANVFDKNATSGLCNYWEFIAGGAGGSQSNECIASANTNTSINVFTNNSNLDTLANFKAWLGTNQPIVYYVLATPTITELAYEPLITQLNLLEKAMSKDGQTNISQVNNDLPFIISVSALKKGSGTASITNDGNIYSKPLIDIEGTGLVTIYLDNTQMFQVDLSELNNITIDTELLEAYSDTQLANRKVVGDYSKFKLQVGTNQLKFGGALTKATITRYKRWL